MKVGIDPNTPRRCKVCGRVLPVSMFAVNGAGYYEGSCRECKAAKEKGRYTGHKVALDNTYWEKRLYALKQNADKRGLGFGITINDLKQCYARQDGRCYYTGAPLRIGSVDRIDTERGYFPDNIIMCERYVNVFRGDMPRAEFIALCRLIAAQHPVDT